MAGIHVLLLAEFHPCETRRLLATVMPKLEAILIQPDGDVGDMEVEAKDD